MQPIQPKILLSVTYVKDGICHSEVDIDNDDEALRLATCLFRVAQKKPLVQNALMMAIKMVMMPHLFQDIMDRAEAAAKEKLSEEPRN